MLCYRQNYAVCYLHQYWRLISSTTRPIAREDLPAAAYQPQIVEKNKYERWEKNKVFQANNSSEKPTFSIVLPPPNVTGNLHLGHAVTCAIQDVIVRRKRSLGYNVLWLPGTDHAGIATQGVVEKYLKTTQNINRHTLGREDFNKEVWKWVDNHGNTILDQLRTLGCSLDWSRQTFTMSPKHTTAVNTAFLKLFEKGLIYRKKALINWCDALKSTVSDIEVDDKVLEGPTDILVHGYDKPIKFGQLYKFAYKIFGSNEEIVVSTTMPETMLGDTAIAVHPEDERYSNLLNKRAYHPFRNRTIPIIFDKFVDMKFGTGAVKITPAHSKVDYDIAKTHNIPLLQVFGEDGRILNSDQFNTDTFNKLKRYECREVLVNKLDDLGLLRGVIPHKMNLPTCSRTGDVIHVLPKEQWFVSCSELNKKAKELVDQGELTIEPAKYISNWLKWTEDDKDWCISRQLWWGHQIPAYKCSINDDIVWVAALDEVTAKDEAARVLRTVPDGMKVERDTDVLDTWFSSALYPFAALGWPDIEDSDYKKYYPLNLMVTGHDILGFWVHRMVILGLELTGKLPFNSVLLHGIICDSKGAKMSKSKGNVIDPIDVVKGISIDELKEKTASMHKSGILSAAELKKTLAYHKSQYSNTDGIPECGVDALRFTLLTQDIKSHFVNFDVSYCRANKLFCNKIWQSVKYLQLCHTKLRDTDNAITDDDLGYFDKWILSRLANMVVDVNNHIDNYDFHLATKALRTLLYNDMCDVYLEATKAGFNEDVNSKVGYCHAHTLAVVLNTALRCLNPFMIHITEELIPKIPDFETNIIYNYNDLGNKYFSYPQGKDFDIWKDNNLEHRVDRLLETLSLIRELKGQYRLSNKVRPCISINTKDNGLITTLKDNSSFVLNMTKCGRIDFGEVSDKNYVKGFLDKDTEVSVEVIGDDIATAILTAKGRLQSKITKLENNLTQLEETFSSERYITTVPEFKQVLDKEKLLSKKQELKQLQKLIE